MAPAKKGPEVAAIVDEAEGVVSIGVVHGGQFLPVASKDLASAKARGLDASGAPDNGDDDGSEG